MLFKLMLYFEIDFLEKITIDIFILFELFQNF
jgi:hypothetical protein